MVLIKKECTWYLANYRSFAREIAYFLPIALIVLFFMPPHPREKYGTSFLGKY